MAHEVNNKKVFAILIPVLIVIGYFIFAKSSNDLPPIFQQKEFYPLNVEAMTISDPYIDIINRMTYEDWMTSLDIDAGTGCFGPRKETSYHILESGGVIVYILCNEYAYNTDGFAVYVPPGNHTEDSEENDKFVLLKFPVPSVSEQGDNLEWDGLENIFDLNFNKDTLIFTSYYKGRGLGDCGDSGIYKFNESVRKVELIEYSSKTECDEIDSEWPVIYRK